MAYKWVQSSAYSSIPPNGIVGGNDEDGAMIYVGRAEHDGDMLVCKVVPSKQIGFVSNRGEALPKDIFEVLCGQNVNWVKCYDHVIPETAVLCGHTKLGQPVYIGRGHYEGHLIVGKISSVHRALFIPFRGAERRLDSYEVLVEQKHGMPGWQLPPVESVKEEERCSLTPPPPPSPLPPAPIEEKPYRYPYPLDVAMPLPMHDRPPMYTATPQPQQQLVPIEPQSIVPVTAVVAMSPPPPTPSVLPAYTPAETHKPVINPYAPAAAYTYTPAPPSFTPADTFKPSLDPYPPPASFTPAEHAPYGPPPAYGVPAQTMPPAHADQHMDIWISGSPSYTPPDAVIAGHDSDMSPLFVCRAYYDGIQVPGKAVPSRGCAYIAHAGHEIRESIYELLIGQGKYHWVPGYDGSIAPGAVVAGYTRSGEPLYIGRAPYYGSLTPGKIHPSHGCLYIPFGGSERRITSYEVLVRSDYYHRQQAISLSY